MASTYTTNLSLRKPEHRDPDTVEAWDAVVNNNMDLVDAQIGPIAHAGATYIGSGNISVNLGLLDTALSGYSGYAAPFLPTTDQKAALAGEGTPGAGNKYLTKSYMIKARKMFLNAEYAGATFTEGSGVAHTGNLTTDVELTGTNYRYNYYKWYSSEVTLQNYDIVCQFRIPETMTALATLNAIVVDICTEEIATTNNKVDVSITKDGSATAAVAKTALTSAVATTWTSEREASSVAFFNAADLVGFAFVAGDTVNITITMYSQASKYVKIGAITFQYTG